MKIFWPLMRKLPSAWGTARQAMAARSEPAWGSVMFMVPVHSPDTSLGSQVSLSSVEPAIISASMAPWVRVMTWEKDRLADFHISLTATARRRGRPWPPCSGGQGRAIQPLCQRAPSRSPTGLRGDRMSPAKREASSSTASIRSASQSA